jgi:hypothetical protein
VQIRELFVLQNDDEQTIYLCKVCNVCNENDLHTSMVQVYVLLFSGERVPRYINKRSQNANMNVPHCTLFG